MKGPFGVRRFARRVPFPRFAPPLLALALVAGACSSDSETIAVVDGFEISTNDHDALQQDPEDRTEDERVGDALILILRQAFSTEAERQLGVTASPVEIDRLQTERRAPNETEARSLLTAELDVLRTLIEAELVTTESDGFDLEAAEQAFLEANAEVCVRQIQFDDADLVTDALARLQDGEAFADVARELSIDPFVGRAEGVGAGGDLGCSTPAALPAGLIEASLDVPLNQPTGPVTSSVGVHVLEVYERTEPDLDRRYDDVISDAIAIQGPELFRRWAVAVLQDIEVEIDDSVGRWGVLPETEPVPTVVPPSRFGDIIGGS